MDYLKQLAPGFATVLCPYKEFTFQEQLGLKRQIESLQPDLVFFPAVQQPVLYHGKTVTAMLDLTTVRFKNPSKNSVVFAIKQLVYAQLNRTVAHKTDAIITISDYVKRDVADFCNISTDKITTTYLAADPLPTPAKPVKGLNADTQFLMYVGRPMPHKNLERLIQSFKVLQSTHPDLKLVLAGKKDTNYQLIEDSVNRQGIANVIFTDFISDEQLRWLYEHCQAYILPSLSEGFGLPGLEAMMHGAPVVSSDATCLPEVYGEAAHYFNPLDVQDMTKAINAVLTDAKLRQQLITKGKKQAAAYSWQRMAKQTLAVYEEVLSSE